MPKKTLYISALALSFYFAQNAGLGAQEAAADIQWRSNDCACWNYLEQRQEVDKASWATFAADERETLLAEAKRACAEAEKSIQRLSGGPLDANLLLNMDPEDVADAKICFKKEGGLLAEKHRLLKAIQERGKNNALTGDDIKWLEENNISQAAQYKKAYDYQALKPKFSEDGVKQQKKIETFNTTGLGKGLTGVSGKVKQGDYGALDNFFDGSGTGKNRPADLSGKGFSLGPKAMKPAGKSPEEQKLKLLQDAKAPPTLKTGAPEKKGFFGKLWAGVKNVGNAVVNTVKAAVGTVVFTAYNFVKDSVGGFVTNLAKGNVVGALLSPVKATANAAWNLTTGASLTVMAAADPVYQAFGGSQPPMQVELNSGRLVAKGGLAGAINNIGPVAATAMTASQLVVTVDAKQFNRLSEKEQKCILYHEFVHTDQYKNSFVVDFYYHYWKEYKEKGYYNIDYEVEAYKKQAECMAR
ncbi:MAG: hypothetical protein KKH28_06265 [Elusimicrobia bacterium]|nr:hypothetical protein [Elusimicrobiota bacterium]